jgi:hypothetical protein
MLTPSNKLQRQRITVAQAEDELLRKGEAVLPNNPWELLKSKMLPGDELWEYCTDEESWDVLMGSAGIELVRDGVVIDSIVTRMN